MTRSDWEALIGAGAVLTVMLLLLLAATIWGDSAP